MERINTTLFIFCLLHCLTSDLSAQPFSDYADEDVQGVVMELVDEKIEILKGYIEDIANKSYPYSTRTRKIKSVLHHFAPSAIIEVSSLNRPKPRQLKAKTYFQRLRSLKYHKVLVGWEKNTDIEKIEFAHKGNGIYELNGRYIQRFTALDKNDKEVYCDITIKRVLVKVEEKISDSGERYNEVSILEIRVEATYNDEEFNRLFSNS